MSSSVLCWPYSRKWDFKVFIGVFSVGSVAKYSVSVYRRTEIIVLFLTWNHFLFQTASCNDQIPVEGRWIVVILSVHILEPEKLSHTLTYREGKLVASSLWLLKMLLVVLETVLFLGNFRKSQNLKPYETIWHLVL